MRKCDECAGWAELLAKPCNESVPSFGFEFRAIKEISLCPVAGCGLESFDLKSNGRPKQRSILELGLKAVSQKAH